MADMAHNASDTSLTRVEVDFNTLNSAPVDLVKIAAPGSWQEQRLPPLCQGQRVLLFDADGLQVEATIIHDEQGWWMAAPDGDTWRDTQPATDNDASLAAPQR